MGVGAQKLPLLHWLFLTPSQDWAKHNGLKNKHGQPGLLLHGLCLTHSSDDIGVTSDLIFSTKCLQTLRKEPARTPSSLHWSVPISSRASTTAHCCRTSIPALVLPQDREAPASTISSLNPSQHLAGTGTTAPGLSRGQQVCSLYPSLPPRIRRQTAPGGLQLPKSGHQHTAVIP